jgi:hypothetical protein
MGRSRAYRWLAALPAIGILGGVPFANHVHRYVLGLPFLLVWIVAWVITTSILMAVIGALDRRRDAPSRRDSDPR